MAKQTKTAPSNATPADGTAPTPAAGGEKGLNDTFTRVFKDGKAAPAVKADGTAAKLAPQAQAIANTLEALGEGTQVTRKDLIEKLSVPGVLTTKQPVGRILSYYQKELVQKGVAIHTKVGA